MAPKKTLNIYTYPFVAFLQLFGKLSFQEKLAASIALLFVQSSVIMLVTTRFCLQRFVDMLWRHAPFFQTEGQKHEIEIKIKIRQ